jgi:hypothetical protein
MMKVPYIGNGAYCYANSISMLLTSIGENIYPSKIEVLSGVGLGAFLLKNTNLLFFGWEVPDNGIDNALKILGFKESRKNIPKNKRPPTNQLRKSLERSMIVVGPLDMGYLTYNPRHPGLLGVDHFVLVYKIVKEEVHLHDPAGFPHVQLPVNKFELAWKADKIGYGKEHFSYWITPKRMRKPSDKEIYIDAIKLFQALYKHSDVRAKKEGWIIGKEAILAIAERVKNKKLTQPETEHLTYFALQLGAKRALDYASFFDFKENDLASLKRQQAELFGSAHTALVTNKTKLFVNTLTELAEVEDKFRSKLLEK